MPSTLYYGHLRFPKTTVDKFTRLFPKSLPNIRAPVRIKPIKLKGEIKTADGRLMMIGQHLTDLFREERIEMWDYKAQAVRPYAERLIQLAIEYGDCHTPTMETCDFYLKEKDLIHKLFKVFVPRYRNCSTAFTSIYQLPHFYGRNPRFPEDHDKYMGYFPAILELKGNPYPPVVTKPDIHKNSLLNILLDAAKKQYALEKKEKSRQSIDDHNSDENIAVNASRTEIKPAAS